MSIRHSGTQLAGGDEIQGLTLAGVGSETELSNIEVVGSNDDGIILITLLRLMAQKTVQEQ